MVAAPRSLGADSDLTAGVTLADVDGDNDLAFANRGGQQNTVHWNDGKGAFPSHSTFGAGEDNTRAIAAADFDGDGFPDLVVANSRAPIVLIMNLSRQFR